MSTAYRADRADELKRPSRAYCRFSLGLVAMATACLILAAVVAEPALLALAVGLALLSAALADCG
jgi:hypothetical protein